MFFVVVVVFSSPHGIRVDSVNMFLSPVVCMGSALRKVTKFAGGGGGGDGGGGGVVSQTTTTPGFTDTVHIV